MNKKLIFLAKATKPFCNIKRSTIKCCLLIFCFFVSMWKIIIYLSIFSGPSLFNFSIFKVILTYLMIFFAISYSTDVYNDNGKLISLWNGIFYLILNCFINTWFPLHFFKTKISKIFFLKVWEEFRSIRIPSFSVTFKIISDTRAKNTLMRFLTLLWDNLNSKHTIVLPISDNCYNFVANSLKNHYKYGLGDFHLYLCVFCGLRGLFVNYVTFLNGRG